MCHLDLNVWCVWECSRFWNKDYNKYAGFWEANLLLFWNEYYLILNKDPCSESHSSEACRLIFKNSLFEDYFIVYPQLTTPSRHHEISQGLKNQNVTEASVSVRGELPMTQWIVLGEI